MAMSSADGLCVFVCIFLSVIGDAEGQITSPPLNAVAEVNGEAVFNCSASSTPLAWFLARDGGTSGAIAITTGCVVTAGLGNHYRTEQPGGTTTCSLIVFDVTMEQAGAYQCVHADSFRALLTVIDKYPNITYNNTPIVKEGDDIMITCALNYSGSVIPAPTLHPHFYWTDNTGGNVSSFKEISSENSSVVSEMVVTARRQDIMPYTCHVYLELVPPTTSSGYASNTPSVKSSASSSTITVLYSPKITSITSTVSKTDKCVYTQENLTCAASANPQAEYEWMDLGNSVATPGPVLLITSGGQFQCTASNLVGSQRYSDTNSTSEVTCYSPYNLTITGSNCPSNSCSCNGGNQSFVSLNCTAGGYPALTFHWWSDVPGKEDLGYNPTINVDIDGNYTCIASNEYGSQPHTATASILITNCPVHLYCFAFKELYICIIVIFFPIYFGLGGIWGVLFVRYIWKTRKQEKFLTRFPILKKMLPCMNNELPEAESSAHSNVQTTAPESTPTPMTTTESSTQTQTEPPTKPTTDRSIQTDIEPPRQPTTDRSTQTEIAPTPMTTTDRSIQTDIEPPPKTPVRKALPGKIESSTQTQTGPPPPPPEATTDRSTQTEIATVFERCLWITLYIVMVIVSGVVVIPAMLLMESCCKRQNPAPETFQQLEVVSQNGADSSTKDPASKNANPEAKSQKDAVDEGQAPKKSGKKRKMKETIH